MQINSLSKANFGAARYYLPNKVIKGNDSLLREKKFVKRDVIPKIDPFLVDDLDNLGYDLSIGGGKHPGTHEKMLYIYKHDRRQDNRIVSIYEMRLANYEEGIKNFNAYMTKFFG